MAAVAAAAIALAILRAYSCSWRGVHAPAAPSCAYSHAKGVNPGQTWGQVINDCQTHWMNGGNCSEGPCHGGVPGAVAIGANRLVFAVVFGAANDDLAMTVAARAGAQIKLCPQPGQHFALAAHMQALGYQFMKLSWCADDVTVPGVNTRRRLWLFQLPQMPVAPIGFIVDDDAWNDMPDANDHEHDHDDERADTRRSEGSAGRGPDGRAHQENPAAAPGGMRKTSSRKRKHATTTKEGRSSTSDAPRTSKAVGCRCNVARLKNRKILGAGQTIQTEAVSAQKLDVGDRRVSHAVSEEVSPTLLSELEELQSEARKLAIDEGSVLREHPLPVSLARLNLRRVLWLYKTLKTMGINLKFNDMQHMLQFKSTGKVVGMGTYACVEGQNGTVRLEDGTIVNFSEWAVSTMYGTVTNGDYEQLINLLEVVPILFKAGQTDRVAWLKSTLGELWSKYLLEYHFPLMREMLRLTGAPGVAVTIDNEVASDGLKPLLFAYGQAVGVADSYTHDNTNTCVLLPSAHVCILGPQSLSRGINISDADSRKSDVSMTVVDATLRVITERDHREVAVSFFRAGLLSSGGEAQMKAMCRTYGDRIWLQNDEGEWYLQLTGGLKIKSQRGAAIGGFENAKNIAAALASLKADPYTVTPGQELVLSRLWGFGRAPPSGGLALNKRKAESALRALGPAGSQLFDRASGKALGVLLSDNYQLLNWPQGGGCNVLVYENGAQYEYNIDDLCSTLFTAVSHTSAVHAESRRQKTKAS